MERKHAVLYCRVSSDEQAKGCSLDFQEEEMRKWCLDHQYEVVRVYREDYSAKTLNRPELNKALSECKKKGNKVDLFLVLRWNRLSRETYDGLHFIRTMAQNGIQVNASQEWYDNSTPEAEYMLGMQLITAHVDNRKRATATRDGIHQTLKKGKWPNKAPRGYRNMRNGDYDKWVEIDPEMGPLVREAFEEVAKGLKAPTLVWREMKSRGLKCEKQSFFDMLRNRFYVGDVFVPAYNNDPDQYVKGEHEPLIDSKTFYKVQDILRPAKHRIRSNESKNSETKIIKMPRPDFYLRDFLTCPICGKRLFASSSKGRSAYYSYYHCKNGCKFRVKADDLNRQFEESLNHLTPPANLISLFEEICADVMGESRKEQGNRIAKLEVCIEDKEGKLIKLQDMLLDGKITPEDYSMITGRLKCEITKLQSERNDLLNQPSDKTIADKCLVAASILSNLGDLLAQLPVNEKIELVGSILAEKLVPDAKKSRTAYLKSAPAIIFGLSDSCKDKKRPSCEFSFTARHSTQSRGRTGTGCPTGV